MTQTAPNVGNADALLRPAEVVDRLGIDQSTLARYRQRGLLRGVKYGPRGWYRYRLGDVEALLASHNENGDAA